MKILFKAFFCFKRRKKTLQSFRYVFMNYRNRFYKAGRVETKIKARAKITARTKVKIELILAKIIESIIAINFSLLK